jgi:hypothetical protein
VDGMPDIFLPELLVTLCINCIHAAVKEKIIVHWYLLKHSKEGWRWWVWREMQYRLRMEWLGSTLSAAWPRPGWASVGWKAAQRQHQGWWDFWLNSPNKVLTKDSPGLSDMTWEILEGEESDQTWKVIQLEGEVGVAKLT